MYFYILLCPVLLGYPMPSLLVSLSLSFSIAKILVSLVKNNVFKEQEFQVEIGTYLLR